MSKESASSQQIQEITTDTSRYISKESLSSQQKPEIHTDW